MGANRWWENYLVRYLMPSIAGVAIIRWLGEVAGQDFRALLFIPSTMEELDAVRLTLLFLYGNLFCYVASYPILCFHATRVLEFPRPEVEKTWLNDAYATTIVLACAAFVVAYFFKGEVRFYAAFIVAALFALIQYRRLRVGLETPVGLKGLSEHETASVLFGFAYSIARRRGIAEEQLRFSSQPKEVSPFTNVMSLQDPQNNTRIVRWHADFVETYRHLREHGNSAFIFILELILCALVYSVVSRQGFTAREQLSVVALLLAVWALPSMVVHYVGQHLERRFSWFDRRALDEVKED